MCGRYTLVRVADVIAKFPWIEKVQGELFARYNIAPTQAVTVIANDRPEVLTPVVWGLIPSWAKDPAIGSRLINARAETLSEKPSFRTALKRRRCLVVADGFYEWKAQPGSKAKTPMYIRMKDHLPFAFAGLWDEWSSDDGTEIRSCTIVTTTPNELMTPIHDRMPAIVSANRCREWIEPKEVDPGEVAKLLEPYPAAEMEAYAVSRTVNSPRNESAACVEPAEAGLWGHS